MTEKYISEVNNYDPSGKKNALRTEQAFLLQKPKITVTKPQKPKITVKEKQI